MSNSTKDPPRRKPADYLNLKRAAELLDVSYDRLRRAAAGKELDAVKVEGGGGKDAWIVTVRALRAYRDAEATKLESSASAVVQASGKALRAREV